MQRPVTAASTDGDLAPGRRVPESVVDQVADGLPEPHGCASMMLPGSPSLTPACHEPDRQRRAGRPPRTSPPPLPRPRPACPAPSLSFLLPSASSQALIVAPRRDRKSTRLNSSHVRTSYAVFCL